LKPLGTVAVEEFKSVVSGCVGFKDDEYSSANFKFTKTGVTIALQDKATISRHLPGKFEDFIIALSTKKLVKILGGFKSDEVKLFFVDELSPIAMEAGNLRVITMPMRLN